MVAIFPDLTVHSADVGNVAAFHFVQAVGPASVASVVPAETVEAPPTAPAPRRRAAAVPDSPPGDVSPASPNPEPPAASSAEPSTASTADLIVAAEKFLATRGAGELSALLQEIGIARVRECPPDKCAELLARLSTI